MLTELNLYDNLVYLWVFVCICAFLYVLQINWIIIWNYQFSSFKGENVYVTFLYHQYKSSNGPASVKFMLRNVYTFLGIMIDPLGSSAYVYLKIVY